MNEQKRPRVPIWNNENKIFLANVCIIVYNCVCGCNSAPIKNEVERMVLNDLKKFEIIRGLWLIVKLANNESISIADLSDGIEDGETPETYFEEIVKDFDRFFRLYAGLAVEAMKNDGDGVFLGDDKVITGADFTGAFDE